MEDERKDETNRGCERTRRFSNGKRDREGAAMFGGALQTDRALMRLGGPFYDGQSKSAAPLGARSRFVHAVETLEDVRGGFRRDADAVVCDAQLDTSVFTPQFDPDR